MATLIQNSVMHGASGKFGKSLVFRQSPRGKTVAATPPRRKAPPTSGELAEREKFRKAALIAKMRAKDPILGPQYLAKAKPGHGAYHVALAEELNKNRPQTTTRKKRNRTPLSLNASIEIANLSLFALNRIVSDQHIASFAQNTVNNPKNTPQPGITPLKRHQETSKRTHFNIDSSPHFANLAQGLNLSENSPPDKIPLRKRR